jgi:hypothetical protein
MEVLHHKALLVMAMRPETPRHNGNSATVGPMRFRLHRGWVSLGVALSLFCSRSHAAAASDETATAEDTSSDSNKSESDKADTAKDKPDSGEGGDEAKPVEKKPGEQDRSFPHAGQFSLRVAFVGAYRVVSRYDASPYCQNPVPANIQDRHKVCGFGAPPAIEVALGFAPINAIEPFAWARFGLSGESDTNTQPFVALGFGARLYTLSDSAFKFFLQPAVGWELEKGAGNPMWLGKAYKQDFLMQLLAGPQYDFSPGVGAYAGVGVTAGILRAIQTWMEFDIGVQARFP